MIERELLHFGYAFIVVGALFEGDATLLTAAFLAHRGYFRLSWVLLAAAVSTFCANQVFCFLARRNGSAWLEKKAGANKRLGTVVDWTRRRGVLLLLASRFMPGCRTIIPVVCGVNGMAPLRFMAWNATGAVIWALAFGLVGYLGSDAIKDVLPLVERHEMGIGITVAAGIFGYAWWRVRTR